MELLATRQSKPTESTEKALRAVLRFLIQDQGVVLRVPAEVPPRETTSHPLADNVEAGALSAPCWPSIWRSLQSLTRGVMVLPPPTVMTSGAWTMRQTGSLRRWKLPIHCHWPTHCGAVHPGAAAIGDPSASRNFSTDIQQ